MHFSILFGFPLEYEKQAKKSQNITFLFLAIHLAVPLKMFLLYVYLILWCEIYIF
jgi:hypothetical protein